jgi:hypothetical protein
MNKMKHKAMKIAAVLLSAAALMVLFIACPIESEYLDRIQEQIDAELDSPDVPTYSVTYHGNENDGGTAPSDGNAYEEGETVTVADKGTLTRTDYYFSGWNTLENGDGDGYASGNTFSMPASDVELHAQWSETPTYTVTYNGTGSDGGSVPTDPIYYEEDDWVEVEGPDDMTKSGHFFIEWNTDENGNGDAYQGGAMFQMGNENVILHAIWAPGETKILAYDGTSMTISAFLCPSTVSTPSPEQSTQGQAEMYPGPPTFFTVRHRIYGTPAPRLSGTTPCQVTPSGVPSVSAAITRLSVRRTTMTTGQPPERPLSSTGQTPTPGTGV